MLPEVHVSLDRLTIQHIYQYVLPFVPGSTLVIGILWANSLFHGLSGASGLEYLLRIAALAFIAYAVGLMLYALSAIFGSFVSTLTAMVWFSNPKWRPSRDNKTISRNRVWRNVTVNFLGTQLTPRPPDLPNANVYTAADQFFPNVPIAVQQYDAEWNDWYNVLQDYVLRGGGFPLAPEVAFFLNIIQATGWSSILLTLYLWHGGHWGLLTVEAAIVLDLATASFAAVYNYYKYDRLTPADLIARLLVEIRKRPDGERSSAT